MIEILVVLALAVGVSASGSMSGGQTAGIVLGCFFFILFAILLTYCLWFYAVTEPQQVYVITEPYARQATIPIQFENGGNRIEIGGKTYEAKNYIK